MRIHDDRKAFDEFVRADGDRLRRALVARYGVDIGCEATDHALAWSWEHWARVQPMVNPAGYVYRVGQTYGSRLIQSGRRVALPPEHGVTATDEALPDVDLATALSALSEPQRFVVLLVHAYGWSPTEVAELAGLRASTVRSHLRRGLRRLRRILNEGEQP